MDKEPEICGFLPVTASHDLWLPSIFIEFNHKQKYCNEFEVFAFVVMSQPFTKLLPTCKAIYDYQLYCFQKIQSKHASLTLGDDDDMWHANHQVNVTHFSFLEKTIFYHILKIKSGTFTA